MFSKIAAKIKGSQKTKLQNAAKTQYFSQIKPEMFRIVRTSRHGMFFMRLSVSVVYITWQVFRNLRNLAGVHHNQSSCSIFWPEFPGFHLVFWYKHPKSGPDSSFPKSWLTKIIRFKEQVVMVQSQITNNFVPSNRGKFCRMLQRSTSIFRCTTSSM